MTPVRPRRPLRGLPDLGVRIEQKMATRAKVVAAARDLFEETGFEETTIRAIAGRAGVSVGSVFTTFASKADLLSEVMVERLDALCQEVERGIPRLSGPLSQRLSGLARLFYEFEMRRPNLYLAYIRTAFTPGLSPGLHRFGLVAKASDMTRSVLQDAVQRGEIRRTADLDLMITALSAYFMWTFRDLATDGADSAAMLATYDRMVSQLVEGLGA